ncbi:MAG: hypothetical protein KDK71_07140, partial [Chlamydiia bacterium]|nr:hypothetical protein [Chlamydiia bacterium]
EYIVSLKKVIGVGGQRKVKLWYNLSRGEFYAKKFIPKGLETVLLNHVINSKNPGLPKVVHSSQKENGSDIFQPYFDKDLSKAIPSLFLSEGQSLSVRQSKLYVIRQVFSAIRDFQDDVLKGLVHTETQNPIPPTPVFHGDIKPANFVINEKTLEVMLIDLGCSCAVASISGTLFYFDPESAKLSLPSEIEAFYFNIPSLNKFAGAPSLTNNQEKCIAHNISRGQARDVWGAALVAASVLFGLRDGIPNIGPLQNCRHVTRSIFDLPSLTDEQRVLQNIANLSQEAIDDSLDKLKDPLVPLLKKMLKVKAKERINMKDACQELEVLCQ